MAESDVRKGMPPVKLPREEFEKRYRSRFVDPAFRSLQGELDAIVAAAWDAYSHSRKAPHTRKAGPGFADPDYEISIDWLAAREAILEAQRRHDDAAAQPRILIINRSARSEHTLPGRDVEKLAAGQARRARVHQNGAGGRHPRSLSADIGVRQTDSPLQVLRLDLDGTLPLAMQLLSELFARADR